MSAALTITESRGPEGWREIGVRTAAGELVAVITRPMADADWFLHRMGRWGKERFKTRKAAIEAAAR